VWLSRAGVIEQAASSGGIPPTVTNAIITQTNSSQIDLTLSEDCTYSTATGITVTSDNGVSITISAIQGVGSSGRLSLSRPIAGTETITLEFASTNGIISIATSLSVAAGQVAVTNNARPSVTDAVINVNFATQTTNTITITMNESCTYALNDPPKISVQSELAPGVPAAAISITSVSGSGTTGTITLSRNVTNADILTLNFSPPNGIVSNGSGLSPTGDVSVTNNTQAAGFNFNQNSNFTWSSVAAGTSVTSEFRSGDNAIVFPAQASGLKVSYPNWVGYGAAGQAVTDTQIVVKSNITVSYGFTTGSPIEGLAVTFVDSSELSPPLAPELVGTNVPYFSPSNRGTATSTSAFKLVNSSATFLDGSVSIGDKVINLTTGIGGPGLGDVYVTAIDSDTTLSIDKNAVVANDDYILQSRTMNLTTADLANISLPTVNPRVGKSPPNIEFDLLSLLSTAKGETVTVEYSDAVPASKFYAGSQMASFFTRFAVDVADVSGELRTLDVRTAEEGAFAGDGTNTQSGPVTVVPRLLAAAVILPGEYGTVYGLANENNGWNLGDFGIAAGAPPPQLGEGDSDIVFTLQLNPYVYNNLTTPPPEPLRSAILSEILTTTNDISTLTFEVGDGSTSIEDLEAQPSSLENIELFAKFSAGGTFDSFTIVGNDFGTLIAPNMEIFDPNFSTDITIPADTIITSATAAYDSVDDQWYTQVSVNNQITVTGSGIYSIATPNLGYISFSLSDLGSSGLPLFQGPSATNSFSFALTTPRGVTNINYNGLEGERASSAPSDYITQTITGTYPAY